MTTVSPNGFIAEADLAGIDGLVLMMTSYFESMDDIIAGTHSGQHITCDSFDRNTFFAVDRRHIAIFTDQTANHKGTRSIL